MSAASELIRAVEANGGRMRVEDGWLVIAPEGAAAPLMEELRQHKAEIIGLLQSAGIPPDAPADWRKPFAKWLDSTCVRSPRCFGGVSCLHLAFCEWEAGRGGTLCSRDTFELLLKELGFLIGEVDGVVLASGLTFREDAEAVGL
jgi:hypothetical protein